MSELNRILHIIDDAPKRFADNLPKIERKIYGEISVLLKGLQIDTKGHIVSSVENLNLVGRIRKRLEKIVVSKEYASLVKSFIADFAEVAKMPAAITTLDNVTKNKISALSKVAIDRTVEGLIGQGFKQDVVGKLYDTLITNVTVGGSYADMVETLRRSFVSDSEGQGEIAKKAKQYVNDTISQFAGQNNKIVADMLGSEWFAYEGSNLTTTREFCEHLVKKRWVHKSEIPTILKGKIDGYQCEIYEKTGLPHGMIAGTDEDNFIVYCGGYNCGHKLIPVNEAAVPKSVRDKVKGSRHTNYTDKPLQEFANEVFESKKTQNKLKVLGKIDQSITTDAANKNVFLISNDIVISDKIIAKYINHPKERKGAVIDRNRFSEIETAIANPTNIYEDLKSKSLVYVYTSPYDKNKILKLIIEPNYKIKKATVNMLKSIGIVDKSSILDFNLYRKIK